MNFKEFVEKIVKLKQENSEIAPCINNNYYLKSLNDKGDIFKPALFFYFNPKDNYQIHSIYDLSDYMDREIKEIKYDNGFEENIIYINGIVTDKLYN